MTDATTAELNWRWKAAWSTPARSRQPSAATSPMPAYTALGTRSAPVSTEASPSLSATTRPAMTVSASSDLVWLSGRGRLLTPHHWWRPRTCPIRLACGLAKECAPYRFGGRECRHRCKDRKYKDRISHVLLLHKPDCQLKLLAQASIIAKWFSFGVGRAPRVGARRRPPQSDHSLAAIAP